MLTRFSQKLTQLSSQTRTHFKEGERVVMELRPGKRFMLTFFLPATVAPPLTALGRTPPLYVQHEAVRKAEARAFAWVVRRQVRSAS
jgi:hypothetical protein